MWNKILIFLVLLCFSSPVMAADVSIKWDTATGATGYKIYQSTDFGVTWDQGTDVGDVTNYTITNVSEAGVVMFKISAYNTNNVEVIRDWSGAWYNHLWLPPENPGGAGIE